MLVPLDVAQMAVQHGHAVEPRAEPADRLRREADLRHQHDRLPAEAHDLLDRLDVDFGLAAAGDAVNQNRAMLGRMQRFANRGQRRDLIGVQLVRRLSRGCTLPSALAARSARRVVGDQPLLAQRVDRRERAAGPGRKLLAP